MGGVVVVLGPRFSGMCPRGETAGAVVVVETAIKIGGSVDSDNKIHILIVRKIGYEDGFTWISQYVKFDQIDRLMEEE
ncbi:GTP-binding protein SAR1A-like [Pyrus ussuriensis x Pyrus communis]|uniref:GTP-binding protein SAR1A-like n=1 Tax=Pyrus ussuriensis x Pyrus communis TaxID=2448454 RepID=A0A5N5FGA7_9ROSA|nr:GTP-binding protein SAR1A-like [Pyrus ussuriensis x Pyrus communis]